MNILAISTSGRAASAALMQDGRVLGMKLSDNGLTHSETIMPLIDALFDGDAPFSFNETDAFAADAGPGSFTGVRIGVCIANAFAYAIAKPVIGISSLEALSYAASMDKGPVCALIDSRNGNGYAALYDNGAELIPPSAVVVSDLLCALPHGTLFTGDGAIIHRESILAAVPGACFAPEELYVLNAGMFCKSAFDRASSGMPKGEVMPLYLRPTQAERLYKAKDR